MERKATGRTAPRWPSLEKCHRIRKRAHEFAADWHMLRDTDADRHDRGRQLGLHRDAVRPRDEGQGAGFGYSIGVMRCQASCL
jgi:hypothetical protein